MQVELEKFLKEINASERVFGALNNASLTSVSLSKDNEYNLSITLPNLLDVSVYEEFENSLKNFKYPCIVNCKLEDLNSVNELSINAYYLYFINKYLNNSSFYRALSRLKLRLEDNKLIMEISSSILKDSLKQYKDVLQSAFNRAGLTYSLEIEFKEVSQEEIAELMKQDEEEILRSIEERKEYLKTHPIEEQDDKTYHRLKEVAISDKLVKNSNIVFNGRIFNVELKEIKDKPTVYSIYVTDDKDSLIVKARESKTFSKEFLDSLVEDQYVRVYGTVEEDYFSHDLVIKPRKIELLDEVDPRIDSNEEKRVELHLHTNFSALDGVCDIKNYIKMAASFGHKAIAVTDHGVVQAFPEAEEASKKYGVKVLYGMEGYLVDDKFIPCYNPEDLHFNETSFVSFDLETTGLSPRHDEIIEIGAVKIEGGIIVDEFSTFINPKKRLSKFTTDLTGITNEDLVGAPLLEEVATNFRKFVGDSVLVAHNASFDYNFINEAFKKREIDEFTNPVIDTLDLAKCILKKKSYSLGSICREYNVDYDELAAHRASYDARVLAESFIMMLHDINNDFHIDNIKDLNSLSPEDAYKLVRPSHVTMLVKNKIGLKNLYRIVSESNTKYLNKLPLIPRKLLLDNKEGLLIGSACYNGEIFDIAKTSTKDKLLKAMEMYDYIEIQPLANYSYLIDTNSIEDNDALIKILNDIIDAANKLNKIVVATGDAHYLLPRDKIYRDAYINWHPKNQVANHPLFDFKHRVKASPDQHFRTTKEMLEGLSFLGEEKAKELVVTNTNKIADMIENNFEIIMEGTNVPKLPGIDVDKEVAKLCEETAKKMYGNPIPEVIKARYEKELKSISENGYSVVYYFAHKLVKKSNADGYIVGSRGSVGSSLVATLCGITEVNPLKPHYVCPRCHHLEFIEDGSYASGYDLPAKKCPNCGEELIRDGQNIPFETFLGFHGDKVPDIDLNFSGDYQAQAHNYVKELLDEAHAFRAGTISAVQEKTAFGVARNFFESQNKFDLRPAEYARIAHGCSGTKRTTGQHPGGIVVVPLEMDILDFTPIQYPADDVTAAWYTTHFDYNHMHDELLKLDILGHQDPTTLRMLKDLTGIDPISLPLNDPKVLSLFTSPSALGVRPDEIYSETGVSGIPEFGTENTKRTLKTTRPTKYSELVQISGLSHGTGVWQGNAEELIKAGKAKLMDVIGCRDDIMTYLELKGLDSTNAFKIMETVRKKNKFLSEEQEQDMRDHGVPEFYIDSARKIEYLFPKAHAVAYVSSALRIAWYKVYKPLEYYAAFFSIRCPEFDIDAMIKGGDILVRKMQEALALANDRSASQSERHKAADLYDCLLLSVEFLARGFKFENVSISKSHNKNFIIDYANNSLIPPFRTIYGLGDEVAATIVAARNEHEFSSKKDLTERTKLNKTQIKALENMGAIKELEEDDQLSLNLFA